MVRLNAATGMLATAAALMTGLTMADSCIVSGEIGRPPADSRTFELSTAFDSYGRQIGSVILNQIFDSSAAGLLLIFK